MSFLYIWILLGLIGICFLINFIWSLIERIKEIWRDTHGD